MARYRGIVTWFQTEEIAEPLAYLRWLGAQMRAGRRVVILGYLGALRDRRTLRTLDLAAVNEALAPSGLTFLGNWTGDQHVIELRRKDRRMMEFERPLPPGLPYYQQVVCRRADCRAHLVLARRDLPDSGEPHGRHRPVGRVRGGRVRAASSSREGGRPVVDRSVRLLPGGARGGGLAATGHHDPVRPAHLLLAHRRRRAAQPVRGARGRLQRAGDPRRDPRALPAAHERLGGGGGGRAHAARLARVPRAGPRDLRAAQRRGGQPLLHAPARLAGAHAQLRSGRGALLGRDGDRGGDPLHGGAAPARRASACGSSSGPDRRG